MAIRYKGTSKSKGLLTLREPVPDRPDISELFSTSLWTGDRFVRDIPNVPNPDAEDILVWIKGRSFDSSHRLFDSVRGVGLTISSDNTDAEISRPAALSAFNDGSFTIGADNITNFINGEFVGWSFKKAPKFFDVIKYTGDGVAGREIPHELGVQAGFAIVKELNTNGYFWMCQHISSGGSATIQLQSTNSANTGDGTWDNTLMTDKEVYVTNTSYVNNSGREYIMYVFAHDPEPDGVIQCGQYTGSGNPGNEINLGWNPQYVLIKKTNQQSPWGIFDSTIGDNFATYANVLSPSSNIDEIAFIDSGFRIDASGLGTYNDINDTYIYMAIRAPE